VEVEEELRGRKRHSRQRERPVLNPGSVECSPFRELQGSHPGALRPLGAPVT